MSEKRELAFPAKQGICESLGSQQAKNCAWKGNLRKKQEFIVYT